MPTCILPFPIFDFNKYDQKLRILSIDPGSNCCGFTILELDLEHRTEKVLESMTVKGTYAIKKLKDIADYEGARPMRNLGYSKFLAKFLDRWQPDVVICESAFMGSFAATYRALVEQVTFYRAICFNYRRTMPFRMIEPTAVKKFMKVKGNSKDKELMREAVRALPSLSYSSDVILDELDEHSVDSICIGLYLASDIWARL